MFSWLQLDIEGALPIHSLIFTTVNQDEKNTHFTLFEFKKIPRQWKEQKDWDMILSKGSILKPCEYKRR